MTTHDQSLIFEMSKRGRIGYSLPPLDVEEADLTALFGSEYVRTEDAELPEVSNAVMFEPVIFAELVMLFGTLTFCASIEVNPVNAYPKSTVATNATTVIVAVENFI